MNGSAAMDDSSANRDAHSSDETANTPTQKRAHQSPFSNPLYASSLSLLTDLYQLTMAYGYWKLGRAKQEAVFHLNYRKNPFKGGYAIACGLESVVAYLERFRMDEGDLGYLATLLGNDGRPLFEAAFLEYLRDLRFTCDIDAIPEGTPVFPHEPLLRVRGPLLEAQILETPLLNLINFQTLIATKAARVCWAAEGDQVLEFGLRRAQGIDGGLSASRSAFVGGVNATSNVLAGRLFGIPVRGTHAHSWIMSFEEELEAFERYADVMPNNCVFLVDTYNTLEGVRNACIVGQKLQARGHRLNGIRLDSGDLAYLSIEARKILDQNGFQDTSIVASNDLDEYLIADLKRQGARINIWGVGTNLVTGFDQPALGGVYKLTALRGDDGQWEYKVKLSEQAIKVSNPGILQVRRYYSKHGGEASTSSPGNASELEMEAVSDCIFNVEQPPGQLVTIVDPMDATRTKKVHGDVPHEDLLVPIFRGGECVYTLPTLNEIRTRTQQQLAHFHVGIKRMSNPHQYPVGLERSLYELKTRLILQARGETV